MPSNESVGLDDDDGLPPIEQEGECGHGEPGGLVGEAARTPLTFEKQGELFSKKEVFRGESRLGSKKRSEQAQDACSKGEALGEQVLWHENRRWR